MLKRTQLKTLTKNRNCCPQQQQQTQHRSTSSGGVATNSNVQPLNEILANPRAKTAADRRRCHHHHLHRRRKKKFIVHLDFTVYTLKDWVLDF